MTRLIGRAAALALAAVLTTVAAAGAATPAQSPGSPLLHIVLVGADGAKTASATPARALPAGVAAALDELRDQLPFERFQLLDAAVTRARGGGRVVLLGPQGERFIASVTGRDAEVDGRQVYIVDRFILRRADRTVDQPVEAGDEPLSASFVIDRGETVVVGSSRLASDDAFVVLLTALD